MLLNALKRLDLPRADDLPRLMMYQLIIAYVLISLPMINLFPIWIPVLAGITVTLKVAAIRFHFVVSKWITSIMLVGFSTLILSSVGVLGKEYTGIAMLFVFASLKILEAREQRDAFLLMLIYLLLIMGALMAQKSPFIFLYLVGCFLYNVYIQLLIAQPSELALSLKSNLKFIGKIILISVPFVAVLFFLFPRFEPLWKTPGPPQANTGLSDEMTPNSLTSLAQDGGLAFRVKFENDKIPRSQYLYWRGPVLTQFDGKTWRRTSRNLEPRGLRVDKNSKIKYRTYHDGSTETWVVPLDIPGQAVNDTHINQNFEMQSRDLLGKSKAFSLTSFYVYRTEGISKADLKETIFLPQKIYPQTRKLAAQIHAKSKNNEAFANSLWKYFRDNEFYYDMEPPIGNSDIDTFLFGNHVGYCEHFSSAFVFMLRSQGVPARVVTGYQGGEVNPISDELEVKQLNAHAWAEVYLNDKGWVRYDPTAAVAPTRINRGSPFGSARNTESISAGERLENNSTAYRQVSSTLRAVNAFWQNWILNYDTNKQNSLWERLGLGGLKYVAWIFILLVIGPITMLIWWLYEKRRAARYGDDIYRAIQPFFRYLEKHHLRPSPSQTLSHWLVANTQELGQTKKYAENVVQHYYLLRYSNANNKQPMDVASLNKAISLFIDRHRQQKIT